FATSMEAVNPSVIDLPEHVAGNDLDLEQNIRTMLENNSETGNLSGIRVAVRNGIVFLAGSVMTRADIAIVDEMVRDMDDVVDVRNHLDVADTPA
ncbi:MAG: BON domain-containing protein, partial [Caldilineaceae bacterium]|nr:BON domain-containing protein [Caldilineaceae bacterium]